MRRLRFRLMRLRLGLIITMPAVVSVVHKLTRMARSMTRGSVTAQSALAITTKGRWLAVLISRIARLWRVSSPSAPNPH